MDGGTGGAERPDSCARDRANDVDAASAFEGQVVAASHRRMHWLAGYFHCRSSALTLAQSEPIAISGVSELQNCCFNLCTASFQTLLMSDTDLDKSDLSASRLS